MADDASMLIDGNSLTYRAFFALPTDMATASGQVTNAVFGFTSMLINLLRDHQPDARRRGLRPARADVPPRAGRRPTRPTARPRPTSCASRWAWSARWSRRCGIPIIERAGLRGRRHHRHARHRRPATAGDDVSSSPATATAYQLVEDPHIKVLYNRRGVSDYALYDEAGIEERTGVPPTLYVAVRRAAGRPVRQPARRARRGREDRGQADQHLRRPRRHLRPPRRADARSCGRTWPSTRRRSGSNAERDGAASATSPLDVDLDDLRLGSRRPRRGAPALRLPRVPHAVRAAGRGARRPTASAPRAGDGEVLEAEVTRSPTPADAVALLDGAGARATTPLARRGGVGRAPRAAARSTGLALVTDGDGGEVALAAARRCSTTPSVRDALRGAARRRRPAARGARRQAAHAGAARQLDVDVRTLAPRHRARRLPARPGRVPLPPRRAAAPLRQPRAARPTARRAEGQLDLDGDGASTPRRRTARRRPGRRPPDRAAARRRSTPRACARSTTTSRSRSSRVLARMEARRRRRRRRRARARCNDQLDRRVRPAARSRSGRTPGEEFNVNSTPQLREILFDELGPGARRRRRRPATPPTPRRSRSSPASTRSSSTCCATARSRSCARPTATGLLAEVGADGRIHATFNQTVARTGRLSLRRSPTCTTSRCAREEGRAFRKAFVPAPGCELLVADYNQIELRCIAHLAEDPGLIAAFDVRPATSTPRPRRGSSASSPTTSRSSSGRRRRWCPTAWPTAWRPTASASGSTSPPTRRPRSSTPTSRRSRR